MKARLQNALSCLGLYLLMIDLHDRLPSSAEAWTVTKDELFPFAPPFFFRAKPKENKPSFWNLNYLLNISWKKKFLVLLTWIIIISYFYLNLYLVTPQNSSLDPSCAHSTTEQKPAGWSMGWQRKLVPRLQLKLVLQKLTQPIEIYSLWQTRTVPLHNEAGKIKLVQLLHELWLTLL